MSRRGGGSIVRKPNVSSLVRKGNIGAPIQNCDVRDIRQEILERTQGRQGGSSSSSTNFNLEKIREDRLLALEIIVFQSATTEKGTKNVRFTQTQRVSTGIIHPADPAWQIRLLIERKTGVTHASQKWFAGPNPYNSKQVLPEINYIALIRERERIKFNKNTNRGNSNPTTPTDSTNKNGELRATASVKEPDFPIESDSDSEEDNDSLCSMPLDPNYSNIFSRTLQRPIASVFGLDSPQHPHTTAPKFRIREAESFFTNPDSTNPKVCPEIYRGQLVFELTISITGDCREELKDKFDENWSSDGEEKTRE